MYSALWPIFPLTGKDNCFAGSGGGPDPNECHVIADALRRFPGDITILTEAARIAMARARFAEVIPLLDEAMALHGPISELASARADAAARLNRARADA